MGKESFLLKPCVWGHILGLPDFSDVTRVCIGETLTYQQEPPALLLIFYHLALTFSLVSKQTNHKPH